MHPGPGQKRHGLAATSGSTVRGMHFKTWQPGFLRRPFGDAGRAIAFHCVGIAIQFGVLLVLALPWIYFVPAALWAVTVAVVVPSAAVVLSGPLLTRVQRARFRERLGVVVPAPAGLAERPGRPGIRQWLRSAPGRRQLRYHLLAGPLCALGGLAVLMLWAVGGAAASISGSPTSRSSRSRHAGWRPEVPRWTRRSSHSC